MLDAFLQVAYEHQTRHTEGVKLAKVLMELPLEDLQKLVTGEAKLAFPACPSDGECSWIDKFKNTPLFDQALELEKAELEADVARTEAQAAQPSWEEMNKTQDQIRVQKKMLELDLLGQIHGEPAPAGPTQPMSIVSAGMEPPAPAPAEEATSEVAAAPPTASVPETPASPAEKAASVRMKKAALDLKALGGQALQIAKKNPKAVGVVAGAAVGAGGGAIAGGPGNRLGGALGGAAVGAGVGAAGGHAAGGIAKRMDKGLSLGQAAQGYAGSLGRKVGIKPTGNMLPSSALQEVPKAVPPPVPKRVAPAPAQAAPLMRAPAAAPPIQAPIPINRAATPANLPRRGHAINALQNLDEMHGKAASAMREAFLQLGI